MYFKPKIFLIGGLGNVYYQLDYIHKVSGGQYSAFANLYNTTMRKILTSHHQPLPKNLKRSFLSSSIFSVFWLIILFVDLVIYKLNGRCLATTLDTTNYKFNKPFFKIIYFGYFQNMGDPQSRAYKLDELLTDGVCNASNTSKYDCIHFRYGDYMTAYDSKDENVTTNMPMPTTIWFSNAVKALYHKTSASQLKIVTDNEKGAHAFFSKVQLRQYTSIEIVSQDFLTDMSVILGATGLINFNSTMSLMGAENSKNLEFSVMSDYLSQKGMTQKLRSQTVIVSTKPSSPTRSMETVN